MSEEITQPTLSKIGLKTDCGIELNAKTAARFIPYGTMLLMVKAISKKANKYIFWSYDPRGNNSFFSVKEVVLNTLVTGQPQPTKII